jgi:NAD(P)-dependent dehydrogenase (short-subunit alcohol dehydrogenase family)
MNKTFIITGGNSGLGYQCAKNIASHVVDKPEKGAMTSIYLATSPEVEGVTGKFFGNREKEEKADDKYYSVENEKTVWDYCTKITKKYL